LLRGLSFLLKIVKSLSLGRLYGPDFLRSCSFDMKIELI